MLPCADYEKTLGRPQHHVAARSTANAFTHAPTAAEIAKLDRKALIIAGVLTEVAVFLSSLSALEDGYDVHVVVDACGGLSSKTEQAALLRLALAGANLTTSATLAAELMGDITQGAVASEALKLLFETSTTQLS